MVGNFAHSHSVTVFSDQLRGRSRYPAARQQIKLGIPKNQPSGEKREWDRVVIEGRYNRRKKDPGVIGSQQPQQRYFSTTQLRVGPSDERACDQAEEHRSNEGEIVNQAAKSRVNVRCDPAFQINDLPIHISHAFLESQKFEYPSDCICAIAKWLRLVTVSIAIKNCEVSEDIGSYFHCSF